MTVQAVPAHLQHVLAHPHLIALEKARRHLSDFGVMIDDIDVPDHIALLCEKLEAVERGEIPRLMVFMPPGGAKSTWTSKLFVAWLRGRHPEWPIIAASYGTKLSRKFGRRARDVIRSRAFQSVFPDVRLSGDSGAADEWAVVSGEDGEKIGEYVATSVDGTVTGLRAKIIIVDDPVKGFAEANSETIRDASWDWWLSDLRTRMLADCRMVLIMTRWHHDDIPGRVLPENYNGESGWYTATDGEEWHVLSIQAEAEQSDILGRQPGEWYWPAFYPPEFMVKQRNALGPLKWNSLYQQRPSPEEGIYFLKEWFEGQMYDPADLPKHLRKYGASDYAVSDKTNDFTELGVCGIDPEDNMFILDWWYGQATADVWAQETINLATAHSTEEWAEEAGQIEKSVGPFLSKMQAEQRAYFYRRPYTSAHDKPTRARSFQAMMASKKVFWPRGTPWFPRIMDQMLKFPNGKYDDAVDVLSLFGRIVDRMIKATEPKAQEDPFAAKPRTFNEVLGMAKRQARQK